MSKLTKKQVSKTILNRINSINIMLEYINNNNLLLGSYSGSTMYSYLILNKPIEVKNQFIYIHWENSEHNYSKGSERFNTNDFWQLDELKYNLSLINRVFKKGLKENNINI